ncbi:Vi polysaccharide biosynthesis UDP-N-acetylglucosamine C-6 dehydrogenase TviB [Nitrosococcus oceani]|uniref:Vi polysaccharide biosynthesis UDP-N-acetylglucosamine C-6 dehydrogenase TviB n=1 Tax=Nitrosococcus oceani TaxID=1229 RepID=UPI0004E8DCDC|nr:Vi polysaccharide biosynthesis UDP-N-acetylglucosamine C-6 dehydrogenase TviB [Nitrosococcus oceani]KFI21741.1 Vi polysaccharide biosynthesis protein VipA/TviB [Nitrosococcus oceani]
MLTLKEIRVGILGLGYVGLPLAVEFGKKFPTMGFDINPRRIAELKEGRDSTLEVEPELLAATTQLQYTHQAQDLIDCNVYIITVPTPIDEYKRPDLRPLESASHTVGKVLKRGNIAIFESTVYPGATEEICVPILERESGLTYNQEFFAGYSPERINPGDKQHRVASICKVISASTVEATELVDEIYASIITAGTHKTNSIRVAEAAKVIENTQRDVNIALINELAMLFNQLGIDTQEVLEAAATKWNFLPFRPGLVGGHCIGIDPYYLTHKAQAIGFQPEMILAGRRVNDGMGSYVASQIVKLMTQRRIHVVDSRILILGLAFKENCPDLRNTRVMDIIAELKNYHAQIDIYDPWIDAKEARQEHGITLVTDLRDGYYDAIIVAVAHRQFAELKAAGIRALGKPRSILYDVKHLLPKEAVDGRL